MSVPLFIVDERQIEAGDVYKRFRKRRANPVMRRTFCAADGCAEKPAQTRRRPYTPSRQRVLRRIFAG